MIRWVKQEHAYGCVLASLAMVTGKTYWEVHDYLSPKLGSWVKPEGKIDSEWQCGIDFSQRGMCLEFDGWTYLSEHGYAMQSRWKCIWGHDDRPQWPCEPWADVHICSVEQESGNTHAVVMLRDGSVLDPLTPEPKRLSDYKRVNSITAIYKVQEDGNANRA